MVEQQQQQQKEGEDNDHHTTLKRRNSLPSAVIVPQRKHKPLNGNHHHTTTNNRSPPLPPSFSAADFELFPLKSSPASDNYTSLKDILPCSSPSSILSPTPAIALAGVSSSSCGSGYEISIRNRLVKQAAWAYLQPTVSTSPSSSSRRLCFSGDFFRPMFSNFRRTVSETVTRVYDWLVDALWLILCR